MGVAPRGAGGNDTKIIKLASDIKSNVTKSFDVRSKASNYKSLSADNFVIEIISWPSAQANVSGANSYQGIVVDAKTAFAKSYDPETGTLTITFNNVSAYYSSREYTARATAAYYVYNLYLIDGKIE